MHYMPYCNVCHCKQSETVNVIDVKLYTELESFVGALMSVTGFGSMKNSIKLFQIEKQCLP